MVGYKQYRVSELQLYEFDSKQLTVILSPCCCKKTNFRLLPGDSVAGVIERVKAIVADPEVAVSVLGVGRDASPVSRTDNPAFAQLHRTIKSVFPQALVAPYVTVAATDARVYVGLCPEATYRFMPLLMAQSDIERLHGTNERLRPDAYQQVVRFYVALIKNVQPPR